ncbi:hypothetical protein BT96DRAFT_913496 [Gymnopus androsaceus JB14]|uniref:Uncharacterized protein n=1 Tax=Gymnopus androsaceus JB14 TaxID=1447944 RepID=A0A6A4ILM4_9AGAR|nr:hypothetical protein BT96DRAFT_913496 [Gymnopus androsaceus JB14]
MCLLPRLGFMGLFSLRFVLLFWVKVSLLLGFTGFGFGFTGLFTSGFYGSLLS